MELLIASVVFQQDGESERQETASEAQRERERQTACP